MSKVNSSPSAAPGKPAKPSADFPLTAHATGRWCKKIEGKLRQFDRWDDPQGALREYPDFLNTKNALVDAEELSALTWADYKRVADELVDHAVKQRLVADLVSDDFAALRNKMAEKWGPYRLKKSVQYTGSIFKHGYETGLIDKPMRFGRGSNARP